MTFQKFYLGRLCLRRTCRTCRTLHRMTHHVSHLHSALVKFLKVSSIVVLHCEMSKELAFEKLCTSRRVSHLHSALLEFLKVSSIVAIEQHTTTDINISHTTYTNIQHTYIIQ